MADNDVNIFHSWLGRGERPELDAHGSAPKSHGLQNDRVTARTMLGMNKPHQDVTDAGFLRAGSQTGASEQTRHAREALAINAINQHLNNYLPSLPAELKDLIFEQWEKFNAGTPPVGPNDDKLSEAFLFFLESKMRVHNPEWHKQLEEKDSAGLLREMASMMGVQIELSRKIFELFERVTVLLAMVHTTRLADVGKHFEKQDEVDNVGR